MPSLRRLFRFLFALIPLLLCKSALAQTEIGTSYRSQRRFESPQRFAFELRFGPYAPQIDDNFPTTRPYETTFGSTKRLYFGLEVDWQMLRIPMLGTLGAGLGWGYTHMSAPAKLLNGTEAAEETDLAIMPMYGVGVLRIDEIARQTAVPLVAYGKAGVGYALYWMGNDVETQSKGHAWGTHLALGGMLLLDNLDPHAAAQLDEESGINNTYLFFEWMLSNLGKSGDTSSLRVGTSTWVLGLAFEF
jgi:hypothetical protein